MSGGAECNVLIAGIGNPDRGDDGFGPAVARRLHGRAPSRVRVVERSGDVLALIEDWRGCAAVVVVDAAAPIGEPGRLHRFELGDSPLPGGFSAGSTHALGLAEAIELARNLNRLPRRLVAYLAEGERFNLGAPLSPAMARAVGEATERIIAELPALLEHLDRDQGAADA
jgi:hydrogenase maturation protease